MTMASTRVAAMRRVALWLYFEQEKSVSICGGRGAGEETEVKDDSMTLHLESGRLCCPSPEHAKIAERP